MTLFDKRLARFSPILCRLLARHRYGAPLTSIELCNISRLPAYKVMTLTDSTNWDDVPIHDALAWMRACGCDITNSAEMRRIESYLSKKPTFAYLKKDKMLWKTFYLPLMKRWLDSQTLKPSSPPPSQMTR